MEKQKSLYDHIANGIADALTDIRQRVIEEPYFGKIVTEQKVTELNFGWPQASEVQPEQGLHEPGHERDVAGDGIDR